MKQFFKYVAATVVGIFVVGVIITILSILGLAGMAAMDTPKTSVSKNSVLVIQLQGTITERSQEDPFSELLGNNAALSQQGMDDIISAIKHAKEEENVKGIYLEAGTFAGAMPATLEAIRKELEDFKKSGKFIVAYGDTYTQGAYYLCSTADTLMVNPQGMINWVGMSSTVTYYKDLLQKVGVDMQVVKVGTYKSAVEPFLLSEMSDANREQIETYEGEIWGQMVKAVSKSRGVSEAKLNEVADSMALFLTADQYKKMKLVDKIAYSDAVAPTIANMMKVDGPSDYNTVTVKDLASIANSEPKGLSGNQIAVYYAVGDIVEEAASGFTTDPQIVGKTVAEDLQKLAEDDDVKAVVLRVNSGGGSAYASEQIWHQVMNIKSKKPIVVSMGDMAASGGYYISCAANYIYAEPTTITGSIGIFGMFPNASNLLNEKLGVHFNTVKTNQYSDFGDFSRPFTEQERGIAQAYVNRGYELFTKRCADGRKMKQDSIKAIGEGRVWTGLHAKKIGLVDDFGGLDEAIAKAKKLAKVEEASVVNYPAKTDFFTQLMAEMTGDSYADKKVKENLGEYYFLVDNMKKAKQRTGIQVSLPYALRFNL